MAETSLDHDQTRSEQERGRRLEAEALERLRNLAARWSRPALLFSGSGRSVAVLRLAESAFRGQPWPFTLLHLESAHAPAELIAFRARRAAELGAPVVVESSAAWAQGVETLVQALIEHGFDACVDPDLERMTDPRRRFGEHPFAFPIAAWTELDVWRYIAREGLAVPSLYLAHRRAVVHRGDALVPVAAATPPRAGERIEEMSVRFVTVGDMRVAQPVASSADTVEAILAGVDARQAHLPRLA